MRDGFRFLFVLLSVLSVLGGNARAQEPGMTLMPECTVVSPKGAFRVEQFRDEEGGAREIVVRDLARKQSYALEEKIEQYSAEISFSPDECYFIRTQKTGSGDNVAILYGRGQDGRFHRLDSARDSYFDGRAWDFFDKMLGLSGAQMMRYHTWTKFLGWDPDGKTLSLELSARHCGEEYSVYAWRLHYDLKTGQFFLTRGDVAFNAKKRNGVHWKRNGKFE